MLLVLKINIPDLLKVKFSKRNRRFNFYLASENRIKNFLVSRMRKPKWKKWNKGKNVRTLKNKVGVRENCKA